MEEDINSSYPEEIKKSEILFEKIPQLKEELGVDQEAIDQARAVVGDDYENVRIYLLANRSR